MYPLRHAIMTGSLHWGLAIALLLMLATVMGQFGLLPV